MTCHFSGGIKLCITFYKNDDEYTAWCKVNTNGFVFNYCGDSSSFKDMNKLHVATCRTLWRTDNEGRRTDPYKKICSLDLTSLKKKISDLEWKPCNVCRV